MAARTPLVIGSTGRIQQLQAGDSLSLPGFTTPDLLRLNGGRLSAISGDPIGAGVAGASTVYFIPYLHPSVSLYDGSDWQRHSFSQVSVAVPSTVFRGFDVFVYDNAGTITLETVDWAQTTGSITNATAASPIVITSSGHGLSNGDFVGIKSIGGVTEANDEIWQVANVTASTFELLGSSGTGSYTSGGTWYKMNGITSGNTTTQDTIRVRSGALTKRYLGSGLTGPTSGQITVNTAEAGLHNTDNRVPFLLSNFDSSSHTYASSTWRPWNNDGSFHVHMIRSVGVNAKVSNINNTQLTGDGTALANTGVGVDALGTGVIQSVIGNANVDQIRGGSSTIGQNVTTEGFHIWGGIEARFSTGTASFTQMLMQVTVDQ